MTKLVIGVVGEKVAGKGLFDEILTNIARPVFVKKIQSSEVLRETLELWNLPLTRRNLQDLAIVMNSHFGDSTLANAVKARIDHSPAEITLFDGVRWQSDLDLVRSYPKNLLVYITAPIELRYERSRGRSEKSDESGAAFEKFAEEEKVATELLIPKIGHGADFIYSNTGTSDEFEKTVRVFFDEKIKEILTS